MNALFTASELHFDQPSAQLTYQITAPTGAALGYAGQVFGDRPPEGPVASLGRMRKDLSRAVVRVTGADGTPLLFIDRAEGDPNAFRRPPCAVVAPDGRLHGRVVHDHR